jgi:CubicO group peptidase (beta-lactamase class C family)
MKQSFFEKNLTAKIADHIASATPGLQLQVFAQGRKVCDLSIGETYAYYDLASLTKVIFTTQAMMQAFEEKKWNLESKIKEFLPWFQSETVTVVDVLTHASGLPWWYPFFEKLDLQTSRLNRWTESARMIREMKLDGGKHSVYSDVGFILLGHVLESFYDKPVLDIWQNLKQEVYARSTLEFHPENVAPYKQSYYAPTERCQWRHKTIQGEVHDDNTWALGGVSTHAGLFGSIDDVSWFGLYLRSQLKGISKTLVKQKTALLFAKRALPDGQGDWALGYMMPTLGASSSGNYFSQDSLGHTGFTGTSVWYDPAQDVLVSLLSNRVFLGRDNKKFAQLRKDIHNWVMEGLKRM